MSVKPTNKYVGMEELLSIVFENEQGFRLDGLYGFMYGYGRGEWRRDSSLKAGFVNSVQGLENCIKNTKNPVEREKAEKLLKLAGQIEECSQRPYDADSVAFLGCFKLVARAYYAIKGFSSAYLSEGSRSDGKSEILLLIGKLKHLQDEKLKYVVAKCISEADGDIGLQGAIICANSSLATTSDLAQLLIKKGFDNDKKKQVFIDMDKLARKEIVAEMSKDAPNVETIKLIVATVRESARELGDDKLTQSVDSAYVVENILLAAPEEYVAKMPDPQSAKIKELEAKIAEQQEIITRLEQQKQEAEKEANSARVDTQMAQLEEKNIREHYNKLKESYEMLSENYKASVSAEERNAQKVKKNGRSFSEFGNIFCFRL